MTILGMDYLGGVKFQSAMLSAHRSGECAGIFMRTFGDARKTVEAMCKSKKFSEIVIHLEPFDSTHRYTKITTGYQDAEFCEILARKYPNTKLGLSMWCEHNKAAKESKPVFDKLKAIAPSCFVVNSIWKGAIVPGVITEIHLENSKPKAKPKGEYIVSFDGYGGAGDGDFSDCDFDTLRSRYSDARQIRGWAFRCNGKFGHKDTTVLAKRKHWPDAQYLKAQRATMELREGSITWKKDKLLKPIADDHGQGGKDNKLMLIHSRKQPKIEVKDSHGNVIDTLTRTNLGDYSAPGTPMHGHARYYSSKYAFEVATKARSKTGSNLVKILDEPLTDVRKRSSYK